MPPLMPDEDKNIGGSLVVMTSSENDLLLQNTFERQAL